MLEWGGAKSFDVAAGSTLDMYSPIWPIYPLPGEDIVICVKLNFFVDNYNNVVVLVFDNFRS